MSKVGLVIKREFSTRTKKRSFLIMTILGPILIASMVLFSIWISSKDEAVSHVVVYDSTSHLFGNYKFKDSRKVKFHYPDLTLEQFKEAEGYDLFLRINEKTFTNKAVDLLYKSRPSGKVEGYIYREVTKKLEELLVKNNAKIDNDEFHKLKEGFKFSTLDIKGDENKERQRKQKTVLIGYVFSILLYFFILLFGVQVMRGVLEEKINRIVEIIVSSVKPFDLLMGKILGVGLVGLTQFLIWVILAAGMILIIGEYIFPDLSSPQNVALVNGQQEFDPTIGNTGGQYTDTFRELIYHGVQYPVMLLLFLFYFIAGYFLYASLFAIVGAAVDSEADTQQFMLPITLPLIASLLIAQVAFSNPDSPLIFWFSIFPLTSPVVMMTKVVMGVEWWHLLISIVVLVGTFIFTTWMAGRIYRIGILTYGKKASYRELAKWIFSKK